MRWEFDKTSANPRLPALDHVHTNHYQLSEGDRHWLITQASESEQSNCFRHELQCNVPGNTGAEVSSMLSVGECSAIQDGVVYQKAQHAKSIYDVSAGLYSSTCNLYTV